jgi:tetratricopeptide (TPR) repeat protein
MAALARSDTPLDTPTPARARALWCAGVLAWLLDEAVAFKVLVDSVELWRTLGDKRGLAYSLQHLGLATLEQADPERALSLELESLTLFRAEGDRLGESLAMLCLAEAANECGDYESEGRWLAECVRASRETQDTWVLALALRHLGRLAITRREFALARPPLEESIQLFLKMGTTHELAGTLDVAATMESEAGDNARAVRLWQQAVVCWRDLGVARGAAKDLRNLGRIARIQGNYDSSRLWLGESLTLLRPAHDLEAVCALLREFGALALAEGESDRAAALYNAADGLLTQLTGAESTRAAGAPLDVSSPAARLQPTLKSKSDFMSLEQAIKYAIEEN